MLCTKIRLTERRGGVRVQQPQHDAAAEGPVVRPCLTRELTECITPQASTRNQRSNIVQAPSSKTPLIVLTLSMSPDTETLVPKDIKRDPRKPPSFCLNFKSANACAEDRKCLPVTSDFYIQGIEIADRLRMSGTENEDGCVDVTMGDHSESVAFVQHSQLECTCNDKSAVLSGLMLKLDGYEMDTFGHLPGDSRTPTPSRGLMTGRSCRILRRAPSPSTEQVIRITMNKK